MLLDDATPGARVRRGLAFSFALLFLLVNLAARVQALGVGPAPTILLLAGVLVAALCLMRGAWLGPVLTVFGATFFLYGFHAYRTPNQVFELLVTTLAVVLLVRQARAPRAVSAPGMRYVLPWLVLYALTTTFSLLLLPPQVLAHRFFLEGDDLPRALLGAFPKDPLYPITSVNRLWLFALFAGVLSVQADGRELCRRLFSGIAWSAILCVTLGLLDFVGVLSLARYNLSHLFYGAEYRRVQSTFGNPSWFACFVACALPFVVLELWQARRLLRVVTAASLPLCAVALFLSGSRASWLAAAVLVAALGGLTWRARRRDRPLPLGGLGWVALTASVATFALLQAAAYSPSVRGRAGRAATTLRERAGELASEVQLRSLGPTSPRRVAAEYAVELAKQKPLLGLGYESFNMHLRAQLQLPGSRVARVVNTAVAYDPTETVFDDAHSTYLQILAGTGGLGLVLWSILGAAALVVTALSFARGAELATLSVALAMLLFHFYGLFQGMAYIPVLFFLFHLQLGFAMTLDPGELPRWLRWAHPRALLLLSVLVLVSSAGYRADRGYTSLKRAFGLSAYLPDEIAEFEGFYRPETGPDGEFRWMVRRGIVNIRRAAPFRLSFTCEHPDLERQPVRVSLRFEGRDAGSFVCSRPGKREQRFAFDSPGALRLSVSRTFRPGAADRRELGLAVSAIRWE